MPYELPPLPYGYDALEPTIDEQTMEIHHGKHHQAYVDNLNKALEGTEWDGQSLERVPDAARRDPRGQARGRPQQRRRPREPLALLDDHEAGRRRRPGGRARRRRSTRPSATSTSSRRRSTTRGVKRFGSGWTWLVWDGTGLAVVSTPNQDSPMMEGKTPLLGIDVWEHAYYLKYQNRRPDYLGAWWDVVNWDEVARRYDEARGA